MSNIKYVRGFPFFDASWIPANFIEEALDYEPHDGDAFIASYPKTGTTWMQYIVLQIVTRAEEYPTFDDVLLKVMPMMEMVGAAVLDATKGKRIFKHHCPYNMMRKNPRAKTIYVYRNPADTLVSFYHFQKGLYGKDAVEFDQFFEEFMAGKVSFGCYFDHVSSFFAHKGDSNLLLVSYEGLHADRRGEILRIAKFLGEEHFEALKKDESLMDKVVERTNFDYMKKNLYLTHPGDMRNAPGVPKSIVSFFRKGIVGDGGSLLSADQLARLRAAIENKMKGTELISEWISE